MSSATLTRNLGHLQAAPAPASITSPTVPIYTTTTGHEPNGHRTSRFMEEGLAHRPAISGADAHAVPQAVTPSRNSIDPATVPMRTSSSRAALNGEFGPTSPIDPRHRTISPSESKRKPQVSESDWYGAGKASRSPPPLMRTEEHTAPGQSHAEASPYVGQDLIHGDGFSP